MYEIKIKSVSIESFFNLSWNEFIKLVQIIQVMLIKLLAFFIIYCRIIDSKKIT